MSDTKDFQRWYERQPKLSQAVKLMIILPDEVRSIIGEAIMLLVNREFDTTKYSEHSRSLGGEKVLGLYKSKNKRREYDQNETLHQAMNYMYVLSDENQDFMASHILKLLEYIQQYFATCREFDASPSLEEVAKMTQQYVISGSKEVERFLKNLRDEFYTALLRNKNNAAVSSTPTAPGAESANAAGKPDKVTTQDDRSGMRIKKLDAG